MRSISRARHQGVAPDRQGQGQRRPRGVCRRHRRNPHDPGRRFDHAARGTPEVLPRARLGTRRIRQRRPAGLSDGGTRDAVPQPLREQVFRRGVYLAARANGQGHALRHESAVHGETTKRSPPTALTSAISIRSGTSICCSGPTSSTSRLPTSRFITATAPMARPISRRWSHGWLLLRMMCFAARKLKFV